jgi:glycosyltransferase involved in cell wall biosynthesis
MRIVSVTPASLDGDSRTLKEATSFARMGHESVVVEAVRSARPPDDVPFSLVTLRSVGESLADDEGAAPNVGRGAVERLAAVLGRVAGPLYFVVSFAAFNLLTARRLPAADLYWLHGYEQFPAVWLRRRPFVYDAHDLYVALPHDGSRLAWRDRAVHAVRERIERACVRRAAARVTTSRSMAAAYEQRFGAAFTVVRNAQDRRVAQPSSTDVRAVTGVGDDTFLLVMVGHHKPGTVVPPALPAGVELAFVGAGYEGTPPPGVHFVAPVPPEQVAAFIATADAAVLLYVPVTDNSPTQLVNGLFHAVAAGLPLVHPTGMDAIRDVAEHHGLGVGADPADAASLAAAIDTVRARHDEFAAAVRSAQADLSWEREEAALADVLATAGSQYR